MCCLARHNDCNTIYHLVSDDSALHNRVIVWHLQNQPDSERSKEDQQETEDESLDAEPPRNFIDALSLSCCDKCRNVYGLFVRLCFS